MIILFARTIILLLLSYRRDIKTSINYYSSLHYNNNNNSKFQYRTTGDRRKGPGVRELNILCGVLGIKQLPGRILCMCTYRRILSKHIHLINPLVHTPLAEGYALLCICLFMFISVFFVPSIL